MNNIKVVSKIDNRNYLDAVISAIILGSMPLLTNYLNAQGSDSISNAFYRLLFAIPLLGYTTIIKYKISIKINKKDVFMLLLASLAFVSTVISLYTSYNYIKSGVATSLHFTYPIMIFILTSILSKSKPSKAETLSVLIFSVALMLFFDRSEGLKINGIILAIISAVSYSLYSVLVQYSRLAKMDNIKILFFINVFGSVMIYIFSSLTGNGIYTSFQGLEWGLVLVFSLILAMATFLYQRSVLKIGAKLTAMFSSIEPITSIVIGFMLLNETLSFMQLLAIVLILLSVSIIIKKK
ncbi:MAG: DMT family transporter [Fusobacteriaceae bacterium]|nr:DMT family transporter [Fusobacteriaceae bacterium]